MERKKNLSQSLKKEKTSVWQSRPLFLSSTFKDMQAERDYLRTHVFPRIQERLYERYCFFEPIDLRHGIENIETESEKERELKILKVCLEEIRLSTPYVIVLLGDRYGWVPPREHMKSALDTAIFEFDFTDQSVTALEIEFSLSTQEAIESPRIFFFFRNPLDWAKIPEDLRVDYNDDYSNEKAVRERKSNLEELKQRLRRNPKLRDRVFTYTAKWDESKNRVSGLEDFGNKVFKALWPVLDQDTRKVSKTISLDLNEAENQNQTAFFNRLIHYYVERPRVQDQLYEFAISESLEFGPWAVCITGPDGAGKSTVASALIYKMEKRKDCLVLSHSAGVSPDSVSVDKCLMRWISKLQQRMECNLNLTKRSSSEEIDDLFYQLVQEIAKSKRLVIVLDALDQFESGIRSKYLTWLDQDRWPANALCIFTSRPGDEVDVFLAKPGTHPLQLPPLDKDEAESIASLAWERCHRQPPASVITAVSAKCLDSEGNPLWIRLASEYLNNLDADDFAEMEHRDENKPAERIVYTMIDLAKTMPADVPSLFTLSLDRAVKYFSDSIVNSFLALLVLGRSGWRRHDLEHLLPSFIERFSDSPLPLGDIVKNAFFKHAKMRFDTKHEFTETVEQATNLRIAELRSFFLSALSYKPLQRLDFSHQVILEAASQHLALSKMALIDLHKIIAAYLLIQRNDDPVRCSELGFHLLEAEEFVWFKLEYGTSGTIHPNEIDATTDTIISQIKKKGLKWLTDITKGVITIETMDSQGDDHLDAFFKKDIQRDIAKGWAKRILEEVMVSLPSTVANDEKLELLQWVIQDLEAAAQDFPGDKDLSNTLVRALGKYNSIQAEQHNFDEASYIAQKASNHLKTSSEHDHCVSLITQGDIEMGQKNYAKAQKLFEDAKTSLIALVKNDPGDQYLLRTLGVSYDKIGDIALTFSDLSGAEENYLKALNIFRYLKLPPPSPLRDLALCLSKLGTLKSQNKELDEAEELLMERLQIMKSLAKKAPQDVETQRDLAGAYHGLQMIAESKGDAKTAVKHAKASMEIIVKVTDNVNSNVAWNQDLAGSHYMLGKALHLRGDDKLAEQHFVESARQTIDLIDNHALDQKGLQLLFGLTQELADSNELDIATEISLRAVNEARTYPKDEMKTSIGISSMNIANNLLDAQKNDHAKRLCNSLLEFWRDITGSKSEEFLATMNFLGIISKRVGDLHDAEQKYRDVYSGVLQLYGENHPATQASKKNFDWVQNKLKQP